MELAQNHSSKQGRQYLQLLYKEVINGYNEYAKATGGGGILVGVCRNENEIAVVRDETSLLHFLTTTSKFIIPSATVEPLYCGHLFDS